MPPTAPRTSDNDPTITAYAQHAAAMMSTDPAAAKQVLEKGLGSFPGSPGLLFGMACALSLLGQPQEGLTHLHRALALGFSDTDRVLSEPALAAVRATPGFTEVISGRAVPGAG
eukprot:RCo040324